MVNTVKSKLYDGVVICRKGPKGPKSKRQGQKSGKGAPDRTFGRSQSWTADNGNNNKKTEGNQPKARTASCSIAESWDDESRYGSGLVLSH